MARVALVALLFFEVVEFVSGSPRVEPFQEERPSRQHNFTNDWFTTKIPIWREVLAPYAGRRDVHYLEVGVFEGRSAIWMLENVLIHPSSTLTGIDLFPGDLKERYLANLRLSGHADKAITVTGLSQIELRALQTDSYDIIYIDGGHTADMVLADAVLCWELLKTGGLLIFDDYRWKRKEYPAELRPGVTIDAFITAYRNYLDVIHPGYQAIVRKKEGPAPSDPYRTILGEYVYVWEKRELRRRSDQRPVELSEAERHLLETLVRSRPFGETAFVVDPRQALDADLEALRDHLGIEFEVRLPDGAGVPLGWAAAASLAALLLGTGSALLVVRRRRVDRGEII